MIINYNNYFYTLFKDYLYEQVLQIDIWAYPFLFF